MLQRRHFQKSQYGQGMVEYAILLILTVTLVIGGIELASATLSSGKASEAAKAGAGDLAAINETRLKAQENQQKYLRQLYNLRNTSVNKVDEEGLLSLETITPTGEGGDVPAPYEDYLEFLDSFAQKYIENELDNGETLSTDLTEEYLVFFEVLPDGSTETPYRNILLSGQATGGTNYAALEDIFDNIDGITDDDNSGIVDAADRDEEITYDELVQAIKYTTGIDTNNDGDTADNGEQFNLLTAVINLNPTTLPQKTARLKTLMLIEEIQLSMLPLDPRVALSESTPLIGDHIPDYNPTTPDFDRPSCTVSALDGATTYNTGFPGTDDVDEIAKTAVEIDDNIVIQAPAVYLFNPLPIDAASCNGVDANRGGRARISILMGGYIDNNNPENNVTGLPKLNQAFYGQYTRICLNNANEYIACGRAGVVQDLLKPPGKLCLSTVATAGVDSCPGLEDDHIETSGYYFWGYGNTTDQTGNDRFTWAYNETTPPEFRPTMQVICNNDGDLELVSGDECDSDNLKTVRINVRYRSVFESFLTFGLLELRNPNGIANLADYFYDPSNLRSIANGGVGVPIAGSELGPKSSNRNPSVKQHKDFRGCYDINIETNAVTSCN
jgi:hypothetical protein